MVAEHFSLALPTSPPTRSRCPCARASALRSSQMSGSSSMTSARGCSLSKSVPTSWRFPAIRIGKDDPEDTAAVPAGGWHTSVARFNSQNSREMYRPEPGPAPLVGVERLEDLIDESSGRHRDPGQGLRDRADRSLGAAACSSTRCRRSRSRISRRCRTGSTGPGAGGWGPCAPPGRPHTDDGQLALLQLQRTVNSAGRSHRATASELEASPAGSTRAATSCSTLSMMWLTRSEWVG